MAFSIIARLKPPLSPSIHPFTNKLPDHQSYLFTQLPTLTSKNIITTRIPPNRLETSHPPPPYHRTCRLKFLSHPIPKIPLSASVPTLPGRKPLIFRSLPFRFSPCYRRHTSPTYPEKPPLPSTHTHTHTHSTLLNEDPPLLTRPFSIPCSPPSLVFAA